MGAKYSIKLTEIISEFKLEKLYAPDNLEEIEVVNSDLNRPALQLAGYFDYFEASRIQLIGKVEDTYLSTLTPGMRRKNFEKMFSYGIPAMILARGMKPYDECVEMAEKYGIPLLRTSLDTSEFMAALIGSLKVSLAPRVTRHGVLVEVYGEGVLLLGESGVGKSETAIELVKRGHRFIADDAVEIKRTSAKTLVGSAPPLIQYYAELRGIGIVDVRRLFGMGSVKPAEKIDLIIHLEKWDDEKQYDRLGIINDTTSILDIKIPSIRVPVKPGRNLAVVIEVAAMNNRHKKLGYNAAMEFTEKLNEHFGAVDDKLETIGTKKETEE